MKIDPSSPPLPLDSQSNKQSLSFEKSLGDITISLDEISLGIYGDEDHQTKYINNQSNFSKPQIQIDWKNELLQKINVLKNFQKEPEISDLISKLNSLLSTTDFSEFKSKLKLECYPKLDSAFKINFNKSPRPKASEYDQGGVQWNKWQSVLKNLNKLPGPASTPLPPIQPPNLPVTPPVEPTPQGPPVTPPVEPTPQGPPVTPPVEPTPQGPPVTPPVEPTPQGPPVTPPIEPTPQEPPATPVTPPVEPTPQEPSVAPSTPSLLPIDISTEKIPLENDMLDISDLLGKIDEARESYLNTVLPLMNEDRDTKIPIISKARNDFETTIKGLEPQLLLKAEELQDKLTTLKQEVQGSSLYPFDKQFELISQFIDNFKEQAIRCEQQPMSFLALPRSNAQADLVQAYQDLDYSMNGEYFRNYGQYACKPEFYIMQVKRDIISKMNTLPLDFDNIGDLVAEYRDLSTTEARRNEILGQLTDSKTTLSTKITNLQNQFSNIEKTLKDRQYPDPNIFQKFKNIDTLFTEFNKLVGKNIPSSDNPISPSDPNLIANDPYVTPRTTYDDTSDKFKSLCRIVSDWTVEHGPTELNPLYNFTDEGVQAINTSKQEFLNILDPPEDQTITIQMGNQLFPINLYKYIKDISYNPSALDDISVALGGYAGSLDVVYNQVKTILDNFIRPKIDEINNELMKSPEYFPNLKNKIDKVVNQMNHMKQLIQDGTTDASTWDNAFNLLVESITLLPGKGTFRGNDHSQPISQLLQKTFS